MLVVVEAPENLNISVINEENLLYLPTDTLGYQLEERADILAINLATQFQPDPSLRPDCHWQLEEDSHHPRVQKEAMTNS